MTIQTIDITDVDIEQFLQKCYQFSRPRGFGYLHLDNKHNKISVDDMAMFVSQLRESGSVHLDYVNGRSVEMYIFTRKGRTLINNDWYDHTSDQFDTVLKAVGVER